MRRSAKVTRDNSGGVLRSNNGSGKLYRIQVLDRTAKILDCFGFERAELGITEIATLTGLHKSTVHRIMMALQYNGFVEQGEATGQYHLGIKFFKLGHQAVSRLDPRGIAKPYLKGLVEETQETVHLAVLDNDEVLYLDKVEGPHALRMPSRVGRHIPTYCTSLGKAMLSCLEEREVERIFNCRPFKKYTPNTISSFAALIEELARTRRRGYSVDNEEIELGLRCVGSPIYDYTGQMVGAISVAGPSARLVPQKIASIGSVVIRVAASISHGLGFEKRSGETYPKKEQLLRGVK